MKALETFSSVTLHVASPSCDVFGILLFGFDNCICADHLRQQFSAFPSQTLFFDLCCSLRKSKNTWSMNDTGSSKSTFFCNVVHFIGMFCVFLAIFMSFKYTDKNNCNLRWMYKHSHLVNFFHPSSIRTFSKFSYP